MFNRLKNLFGKISALSKSIDNYRKDTVVQSLPSLTYVNRAKKFIEKNRFVEAEGLLLKALELTEKDALVYKYLGLVYERTGAPDLAVENYQKSADLNPNDKNIWQRLGFALLASEKFEQAEKSFENANRIQPLNTDTFTGWGMTLMKTEKLSEAHEKFENAVKINKYNFSALFLSAVMEIKLGIYDKADSKLLFLTNKVPNEANTFEYARLKAIKDDFDNAILYAKKALLINPKMLPAYVLLGQLYTRINDEENALKSFEDADKNGMTTPEFYLEWARSLMFFERYEEAKEKLQIAKDKSFNSDDLEVNIELCNIFTNNDDLKELSKDDLVNGIRASKRGEFEDALKYLHKCQENNLCFLYIAKSYEGLANDTKAREYYESALNFNEKSVNTCVNYVNYLISQNDYKEARRKLRKTLKYRNNNIKLLNLMFYVSYILVKDDFSEYNVKEALSYANTIEEIGTDLFEYPRQKEELEKLLPESE